MTLLDLPVFCAIQPEELSSCKWNKKNKREIAPNIVAFITRFRAHSDLAHYLQRFNHVSFWTVQEILRHDDLRSRTDTLAHFIKVGTIFIEKLVIVFDIHRLPSDSMSLTT